MGDVNCKNYTILADKSGWQPLSYAICYNGLDVYGFLSESNVVIALTETSITSGEFPHQTYNQNLFAGESIAGISSTATINNKITYALSSANGSLTSASVDNMGYQVEIVPESQFNKSNCLWDCTKYWPKLSEVDKSIVYAARSLFRDKKLIILANDNNLIDQLSVEGFNYFRNSTFLGLMVKSGHISYQKGTSIYDGWQIHDSRWTLKEYPFRGILNK